MDRELDREDAARAAERLAKRARSIRGMLDKPSLIFDAVLGDAVAEGLRDEAMGHLAAAHNRLRALSEHLDENGAML